MSYVYGTGTNANYSGRPIVYPNQVPFDTDNLRNAQYRMVDVAMLAQTILGLPLSVGGSFLSYSSGICIQDSAPDMAVTIGTCAIYALQEMEPIAYGNLGPLTTPLIYKQFINMLSFNSATLGTITAPSTSGYSQYYLIQGTPNTQQINSVSRPYYNPSNPAYPIFNSAADTEIDNIIFALIAGTPAATGTETIPTPVGSGAVGMFTILVTHGQTTILNADIAGYPGSYISETLVDKISQATGDARYVQIDNLVVPETTYLTSGSGTYTTPAGALYLDVEMAGDGGGSQGSGTSPGNGTNGSGTTFGTLTAGPGGGGGSGVGGVGGTATGGDLNIAGGNGGTGVVAVSSYGGAGGQSYFGGGSPAGAPTGSAFSVAPNTGGGAGGAGSGGAGLAGCGGGAGSYLRKRISSPSATYAYSVGAGGAGGAAGGSGFAGTAGGSGLISVTAHFQ